MSAPITGDHAGVLVLAADACPTLNVPVTSTAEASARWQAYRDQYCLGSSDMSEECGNIYDHTGTLLATVSYNGRVWNPRGELLQEAVHGLNVELATPHGWESTPPAAPSDFP